MSVKACDCLFIAARIINIHWRLFERGAGWKGGGGSGEFFRCSGCSHMASAHEQPNKHLRKLKAGARVEQIWWSRLAFPFSLSLRAWFLIANEICFFTVPIWKASKGLQSSSCEVELKLELKLKLKASLGADKGKMVHLIQLIGLNLLNSVEFGQLKLSRQKIRKEGSTELYMRLKLPEASQVVSESMLLIVQSVCGLFCWTRPTTVDELLIDSLSPFNALLLSPLWQSPFG